MAAGIVAGLVVGTAAESSPPATAVQWPVSPGPGWTPVCGGVDAFGVAALARLGVTESMLMVSSRTGRQ
ncbi:MAG: hypothetical protein ACRDPY_07170 [Streptosporangiaceae bacterium]